MSSPLLEICNVHAAYFQREILRGVSLTVAAGEMVALLGENGAGKSTVLKIVAGLLYPSKGSVRYHGRDLNGCGVAHRQQLGIGYLMQGGRVFPNLTVQENSQLAAVAARRAGREPSSLGDWFPALRDRCHDRAGLLSGGQRQMLAIELVLAQRPELLLLDEPTGTLTVELANGILQTIQTLVSSGTVAALLVEQNVELAAATCIRTQYVRQGMI